MMSMMSIKYKLNTYARGFSQGVNTRAHYMYCACMRTRMGFFPEFRDTSDISLLTAYQERS